VPKYHPRIEVYGTVDELIAFVGLLRDQEMDDGQKGFLVRVQDRLMNCASIFAADCTDCKVRIPQLGEADISEVEAEIDRMDLELEPLRSVVLPGGHQTVSLCHVCRTICRRAERLAIRLSDETPVPENVIKYINRLSDYFFVLARKVAKDLEIEQIKWQPGI